MSYDHAGKLVARALKNEGVEVVFTLCGGHVMSIYDGCVDEGIQVVDLRHEQSAAFAADGWSRTTGKPGVAIVTAGPGVTNAVTAVANASRAQSPMVIIGGRGPANMSGRGSLQEVELIPVMAPITKWQVSIADPARVPELISVAFRKAISGVPGPVYVEMPLDLLFASVDLDDVKLPAPYAGRPALPGDPARVREAVEMLRDADRPFLFVSSQIRWSPQWEVARAFAEQVGAPIYLQGMARGLLDSAWGRSRKAALAEADVAILFGAPLDFRLGYGAEPLWNDDCKLIRVDLDPSEPGHNRDTQVAIPGDSGSVMAQMLEYGDLGGAKPSRQEWLAKLRAIEEKQAAKSAPALTSDSFPIDPLRLCAEIDAFLPENAIVVGDGGDIVATFAAVYRVRQFPSGWLDPGPLGTLGMGMGFAMAAKLARPDAPILLMMGDGAAGLNLMEVEAAARQNIPFVVVIGNDAGWTQIRRGQIQMFGEERAVATKLDFTRYDQVAIGLGGHGEYVERPEEIRPALERAFASGKVAVINVKIGSSDFRAGAISV